MSNTPIWVPGQELPPFKCGTKIVEETTKRCSSCKQDLPHSDFHRRKERRNGLQPACKACQAANTKRWRETNRMRHRELSRASYARGQGYTGEVWDRLQSLKQKQASLAAQITKIEACRKV